MWYDIYIYLFIYLYIYVVILILISHLPLRLSIVPFPSGFTTKTLYAIFISPIYTTYLANPISLDLILMIILPMINKLCCFDSKCYDLLVCVVVFMFLPCINIINQLRPNGHFSGRTAPLT